MGKYPAYPVYKSTGMEWLGNIPIEWDLCPLKYMATIRNGQDYKLVEEEDGYPVIGSGGKFAYASKYLYNKESVLLGRKGTIDKPIYMNKPFWTVDTMYYTEIQNNVHARFLFYLALTIPFDRYSTNTALPSMTQENLSNFLFATPKKIEEQAQIAAFLDYETAKIDTLIAKQQQLIALLQEKRQAVISHAVTKGLHPDAPMKDSGVEWLGQIPAHWKVTKLNHQTNEVTVGIVVTPAKYYKDSGVPCLRSLNIGEGFLKKENFVYISKEDNVFLSKSNVFEGDIVVVRTGQPGTAAVVDKDLNACNCIDLIIIRKSRSLVPKFLEYFLNSEFCKRQVIAGSGGAIQQHFNVEVAKSILVTVPPLNEQESIVNILQTKERKLNDLIDMGKGTVELLMERRTALISAAVTGKIDVRNWQRPEPSEAPVEDVTA